MSARAWRWVVVVTVIATAAVAAVPDFRHFVYQTVRPQERKVVECQDSPACRAFIKRQIEDALNAQKKGVDASNGNKSPSGPPGPAPPGGGAPGNSPSGGSSGAVHQIQDQVDQVVNTVCGQAQQLTGLTC